MRPIDADKVMEEINRIGGHNLCEWDTLGVKALICRQDTIDVVPREEFEDLQRRYDLAVAEREANAKALIEANIDLDAMRGAANSYKMHYDSLARKIFEEIESKKLFVRDRVGNMRAVVLFEDIAELKKKYTEDAPDGKRTDR